MAIAYVDTSCLTAVVLGDRGAAAMTRTLRSFEATYSSNLLESELRAVLRRERVELDPAPFLSRLNWVIPDRLLTLEFQRVLQFGYIRGADLWHLACALYLSDNPADLVFLTLDERQAAVSSKVGFAIG